MALVVRLLDDHRRLHRIRAKANDNSPRSETHPSSLLSPLRYALSNNQDAQEAHQLQSLRRIRGSLANFDEVYFSNSVGHRCNEDARRRQLVGRDGEEFCCAGRRCIGRSESSDCEILVGAGFGLVRRSVRSINRKFEGRSGAGGEGKRRDHRCSKRNRIRALFSPFFNQ